MSKGSLSTKYLGAYRKLGQPLQSMFSKKTQLSQSMTEREDRPVSSKSINPYRRAAQEAKQERRRKRMEKRAAKKEKRERKKKQLLEDGVKMHKEPKKGEASTQVRFPAFSVPLVQFDSAYSSDSEDYGWLEEFPAHVKAKKAWKKLYKLILD